MRNYACPVKTDIYRAFLKIWASFCGTIYIVLYDCSTPVLEQSVITHIWLCCGMQKDEKALVIGGKVEAACQMFMMKLKSCRGCPGDAMVGAILCGCGPCVCKTNPVVDLATMIMDSLI